MQTEKHYEFVDKASDVPLILGEAEKEKYVALDTENSGGLDVLKDDIKLLLLQLNVGGTAYVIDARKVDLSLFRDIIENKRWIKIVQNANYDYKVLRVFRKLFLRGIYDTMIAEAILQAGLSGNGKSLENLALKYLSIQMDKTTVMTFVNHPYDAPFTEEQIKYAANDVLVLPDIRRNQQMYINQYGLNAVLDIEFRLIEPVADMELSGIRLDTAQWRRSLDNTNKKLFKISNELRQVLPDPPVPPPKAIRLKKDGTPFANNAKPKPAPVLNIDSWQQLVESFGKIGIDLNKVNEKTRKGPTNNGTLKFAQSMYHGEPDKVKVLKNLIIYRGLNQVKKTFGENLIDHVTNDGRIHAKFWQNGTESGRFSSTEPNLQNIQKKGEEGHILRSCFIPAPGCKFVIADYSQIELRVVAELSSDPLMLSILNDPKGDIHRGTASQMYKVPYNQVTSSLRRAAKTLNFGIIYGMQIKTLAERLDCSSDEAAEHLQKYNETYPTLMGWLEAEGQRAYDRGWTKTIGGRMRWFPHLDSAKFETLHKFKSMIEYYKRVGKNHPVQGTSADMTKLSIVMLYTPFIDLQAKLVNTIHDELCVEVPLEHTIEVAKLMKQKMILAGEQFLHKVPVLVDIKIRDSWWKDDGVDDSEDGQQLWLMPYSFGLDNVN